jgi:uncharacterized protein YcbK (DUF882 family)
MGEAWSHSERGRFVGVKREREKHSVETDDSDERENSGDRLKPDVRVLRNWYKNKENQLGESLFQGFIKLNQHLEDQVGKHLAIGQSYLMRPSMNTKTLAMIWDQQLMPLIEEYFFDRPNLLGDFSKENYWS